MKKEKTEKEFKELPDIKWKCNACGNEFEEPEFRDEWTPICPKCKSADVYP